MDKLAVPIILAFAAVSNYALATAIWYFSSRGGEYAALMKRIQPPEVMAKLNQRGVLPGDARNMRVAAVVCAIIATGLSVAAGWLWVCQI